MRRGIRRNYAVLFFVLLGFTLCNSSKISATQVVDVEEYSINAMVRPSTPITLDLVPDLFRFETNYTISRSFLNIQNSSCLLKIPVGSVMWSSVEYDAESAVISDNLGNRFDPVLSNGMVSNPYAEVDVPPNYKYSLNMSFKTQSGIEFDSSSMTYMYGIGLNVTVPTRLEVRFPSDFTVLRYTQSCTTDFKNDSISLRWNFSQNQTLGVFVGFLPVSKQPTLRSLEFTLDIPSVFPLKGAIEARVKESFETRAIFGVWKLDPLYIMPVAFPTNTSDVRVKAVRDGIGDCKEILRPIDNPTNDSLGYYFADYENGRVIVYPRYHFQGDFLEYEIETSLTFPKPDAEIAPQEQSALPYRYKCTFSIADILPYGNWRSNISQGIRVRFILPPGIEIVSAISGNPAFGVENSRTTASFVNYSLAQAVPSTWAVEFDVLSLRNFFNVETIIIVGLFALLVIIFLFWKPEWKGFKSFILVLTSSLIPFIVLQLLNLGSFDLRFPLYAMTLATFVLCGALFAPYISPRKFVKAQKEFRKRYRSAFGFIREKKREVKV